MGIEYQATVTAVSMKAKEKGETEISVTVKRLAQDDVAERIYQQVREYLTERVDVVMDVARAAEQKNGARQGGFPFEEE